MSVRTYQWYDPAKGRHRVFTQKQVDLLRELRSDPGRVLTNTRRGVLYDHNQALLELSVEESNAKGKPHEKLTRKLQTMFCVRCDELASDTLCGQCDGTLRSSFGQMLRGLQ